MQRQCMIPSPSALPNRDRKCFWGLIVYASVVCCSLYRKVMARRCMFSKVVGAEPSRMLLRRNWNNQDRSFTFHFRVHSSRTEIGRRCMRTPSIFDNGAIRLNSRPLRLIRGIKRAFYIRRPEECLRLSEMASRSPSAEGKSMNKVPPFSQRISCLLRKVA